VTIWIQSIWSLYHSQRWVDWNWGMDCGIFVYSRQHHCTLCSGCFCPLPPSLRRVSFNIAAKASSYVSEAYWLYV